MRFLVKRCMYAMMRKGLLGEPNPFIKITDISQQTTSRDLVAQPSWGLIADMRHNATTLRLEQWLVRLCRDFSAHGRDPLIFSSAWWGFLDPTFGAFWLPCSGPFDSHVRVLGSHVWGHFFLIEMTVAPCRAFCLTLSSSIFRYEPFFGFIEMGKVIWSRLF
jgi:hypothetical protein